MIDNWSLIFVIFFCPDNSQPLPSSTSCDPPPEGHVQTEGEGQEQDREQAALLRLLPDVRKIVSSCPSQHGFQLSRGLHPTFLFCKEISKLISFLSFFPFSYLLFFLFFSFFLSSFRHLDFLSFFCVKILTSLLTFSSLISFSSYIALCISFCHSIYQKMFNLIFYNWTNACRGTTVYHFIFF